MKTAEQIIAHIRSELAEAYEMYDKAKGKDAAQAFAYMLKATVLTQLLEEIENE